MVCPIDYKKKSNFYKITAILGTHQSSLTSCRGPTHHLPPLAVAMIGMLSPPIPVSK